MHEIAVFSGSAHPELAADICAHLGVPLRPVRVARFANDCLEVQLQANCRERDVFLIQPLVPPVQENLVELLLMLDAARGASAARTTVVLPHYAYARSDKKDMPRVSIGGRLVADLLVTAGREPGADHDPALAAGARLLQRAGRPPARAARAGRATSAAWTCPTPWSSPPTWATPSRRPRSPGCSACRVAAGAKQRFADDKVSISSIIGDVAGKDVIVLDDEIARGTTVVELVERLHELGVASIRVACTHGLFADGAIKRIGDLPGVTEIVCTDTVPIAAQKRTPKLTVLSIAPAMAEAIRRIHNGESVSALFDA